MHCDSGTWIPDEHSQFTSAIEFIIDLQRQQHDQRIEVDHSGRHAGVQDQIVYEVDESISSLRRKLPSVARITLAQLLALRILTRGELQLVPDLVSYLNECAYTTEPVWQTNEESLCGKPARKARQELDKRWQSLVARSSVMLWVE